MDTSYLKITDQPIECVFTKCTKTVYRKLKSKLNSFGYSEEYMGDNWEERPLLVATSTGIITNLSINDAPNYIFNFDPDIESFVNKAAKLIGFKSFNAGCLVKELPVDLYYLVKSHSNCFSKEKTVEECLKTTKLPEGLEFWRNIKNGTVPKNYGKIITEFKNNTIRFNDFIFLTNDPIKIYYFIIECLIQVVGTIGTDVLDDTFDDWKLQYFPLLEIPFEYELDTYLYAASEAISTALYYSGISEKLYIKTITDIKQNSIPENVQNAIPDNMAVILNWIINVKCQDNNYPGNEWINSLSSLSYDDYMNKLTNGKLDKIIAENISWN